MVLAVFWTGAAHRHLQFRLLEQSYHNDVAMAMQAQLVLKRPRYRQVQ